MTDTFVDFGFLGGCSNETAYDNCKLENIPDDLDVEFNFTVCEFSIENFDYFHECAKDAVGGCVSDSDNATQICTLLEDFDNFGTGDYNLFLKDKNRIFRFFLQYVTLERLPRNHDPVLPVFLLSLHRPNTHSCHRYVIIYAISSTSSHPNP